MSLIRLPILNRIAHKSLVEALLQSASLHISPCFYKLLKKLKPALKKDQLLKIADLEVYGFVVGKCNWTKHNILEYVN